MNVPKTKGSSLVSVKALNRLQIRRAIYYNAPLTRQQIADELGVSLPTVTTSIAKMLAEGLLMEYDGEGASPLGGRKPQLVDFQPDAYYAAGLEFGPYGTRACVTDLRGTVRCRKELAAPGKNYDKMLTELGEQLRELLSWAAVPRERLLGLGVGISGFVDGQRGMVRTGLYASWADRPLAADLQARTGLPTWIDNNVRMRTFWRELFSRRDIPSNFVYLFVAKGIACPLMLKNDIVAGKQAAAGELGHTTILPGGPVCPVCGRRGCLEAIASETAILERVQQALGKKEYPHIRQVLDAQRAGEPTVCGILREAVYYLGLSVANIFNFLSPGLVCIDGLLFGNPANQQELARVIRENLFGLAPEEARIEFLPHDPYTGAYGAAACVVRKSLLS